MFVHLKGFSFSLLDLFLLLLEFVVQCIPCRQGGLVRVGSEFSRTGLAGFQIPQRRFGRFPLGLQTTNQRVKMFLKLRRQFATTQILQLILYPIPLTPRCTIRLVVVHSISYNTTTTTVKTPCVCCVFVFGL